MQYILNKMNHTVNDLKSFLDQKSEQYNSESFIKNDPISIPHEFSKKEDIEIMGFFASIFAWGKRSIIIDKGKQLAERMDKVPFDFVINHTDKDLQRLLNFKHRTFNEVDLLYSIDFLKKHYLNNDSLETAFFPKVGMSIENGLNNFYSYFFESDYAPQRTKKHIACPMKKSACKRLNMYLRWMVRSDEKGVDFGLWRNIKPKDLICPLDLHVERTARKLGLLKRTNVDWSAAVELTENLRLLDPKDPVKYDFALFGISIDG